MIIFTNDGKSLGHQLPQAVLTNVFYRLGFGERATLTFNQV